MSKLFLCIIILFGVGYTEINTTVSQVDCLTCRCVDSNATSANTTNTTSASAAHADDHHDEHPPHEHFIHIYMLFAFLILLWVVGKMCEALGVPPILGVIIMGIVLGPELGVYYNYDNSSLSSYVKILKSVGELGLILLVMEAGVEVDAHILKLIGFRGLGVACGGAAVSVTAGIFIAIATGSNIKASLAIGFCWAPASMGIALAVLKGGNQLNTVVGQLVVASAVLCDIITLILLGFLRALENPTAIRIMRPLLVSVGFLLFGGFMAFKVMPRLLPWYMSFFNPKYQTYTLLSALFFVALIMIPAVEFAGSSMLLGAFLTGLMFSCNHDTHAVFVQQLKRPMVWLLRVFFAATIGFEIPITKMWTGKVIGNACLYFLPVFGKFLQGVWVPGRKWIDMMKIGFAMSMRGEFAFILAKASLADKLVSTDEFGSLVFAVLLSIITGPLLLGWAIKKDNASKAALMGDIEDEYLEPTVAGDETVHHDKYMRVITKSKGYWGFYERMESVMKNLKLKVLDYRTSHTLDKKVLMESFVVDTTNYSVDSIQRAVQKEKRRKHIVDIIRFELKDDNAQVSVNVWHPKVSKKKPESSRDADDSGSEASEEEGCLYLSRKFKKRSAIKVEKTIARAMHQMATHGLEALLCVEEERDHEGHRRHKIVGMITQQEIFESMDHEVYEEECSVLGTTKRYLHDHKYTDESVATNMIPIDELVSCTRVQSRAEILGLMGKNNTKHIILKNQRDDKQVDYLLNIVALLSHMATDHLEAIDGTNLRDSVRDARNSVFQEKDGQAKTFERQFRQLSLNFGDALDWNADTVDLKKLAAESKKGREQQKSRKKNLLPPGLLAKTVDRLPGDLRGVMRRESMIAWDAYQLAQNFVPPEEEMLQMQAQLHEKLQGTGGMRTSSFGARRSVVFSDDGNEQGDGALPGPAVVLVSEDHSDDSLGSFEADKRMPRTNESRSNTPTPDLDKRMPGAELQDHTDSDPEVEAEFNWTENGLHDGSEKI